MVQTRNEPDASRRSERARLAVLEATQKLIGTVGYDNMSIDAIAATAGVGKQTIYRWWRSKAAVVLEMWTSVIPPAIEFPDTGDLAADLKSRLKTIIELVRDPVFGPPLRALIAESQYNPEIAEQLLDRIIRPRIEACKTRLRAAQAAGQLGPDIDLDVAADLFYGGFYHRYILRLAPFPPNYADAFIDGLLQGISPPTRPRGRTRRPSS